MVLVQSQNPESVIALLFQRNQRLTKSKNSKTYVEWAIRYNFPVAIGIIPDEWFQLPRTAVHHYAVNEPTRWLDERTKAKTRILRQ
jgi:hypothetical protein